METEYTKFKNALIEMYKTGELDKVYKFARFFEKRKVKHDIKVIGSFVEFYEANGEDVNTIPIFAFITEL